MYLEALTKHTGGDPALARAFAAGFVSGQAEKVYLGACMAAMFRPSADKQAMILELVQDACDRYSLLSYDSRRGELWICRDRGVWEWVHALFWEEEENTPNWHRQRAVLCGIPGDQMDLEFHKRQGWNVPCDNVPS